MIKDIIKKFYFDKKPLKRIEDLSYVKEISNVTTLNIGIGDAVIMTALSKQNKRTLNIYSLNRHWQTLCNFNKNLQRVPLFSSCVRSELLEFVYLGNGHLSQRLQRAFGLDVEIVPKPFLDLNNLHKKNKIGLHFSTGASAKDLESKGFKNPRQLEKNTKIEIEKFINSSNYEFVEFGYERILENEKVKDFTKKSLDESILELSECEYFIGLNSGFMNLAAAMSIKSIIIVNVPDINNLYLPVLEDISQEDTNWLYPQNVHLHQNGENELVKYATEENIKKAINGELYPFWTHDYLDLIYDKK